MKSVLELEPRDWTKDPIKDLKWKGDVVDLIEEIFIKICPKVDQNIVESIADVFLDFYVLRLKGTVGKPWAGLQEHLVQCRDNASTTPMVFKPYGFQEKMSKEFHLFVPPEVYYTLDGNEVIFFKFHALTSV